MTGHVTTRALGAAALAVAALPACAALVVHDNSAQTFTWTRGTIPIVGQTFWGAILDPTLPAAAQTGAPVDHGFAWLAYDPVTSTQFVAEDIVAYDDGQNPVDGRVARSPDYIWVGPYDVYPAKVFPLGQQVGAAEDWREGAPMGWSEGFAVGQAWFLGEDAHVGIRFTLPTGTHYGWIRLKLVPGISPNGHYQPIAWAYETTPGAPALVPAPAAWLALGIAGMARRRRR